MTKAELEAKHLAELHELAARSGVPRYRVLERDELIEELLVRGADQAEEAAEPPEATEMPEVAEAAEPEFDDVAEAPPPEPEDVAEAPPPEPEPEDVAQPEPAEPEPRRPRFRRRRRREPTVEAEPVPEPRAVEAEPVPEARPAEPEDAGEPPEREQGDAVSGVLEVVSQGHGYLRLAGLEPRSDDVYVSASQIRRCELRPGDEVGGPARPPRRGERHPALTHVETVNGAAPSEQRGTRFEEMTPVAPRRRLALRPAPGDVLVRAADLLAPLAYGQRVLVRAAPRSGRTTLLRALVRALTGGPEAAATVVLLVDERPEEVTEWRRQAPEVEIAAAAADLEPAEQARHAELALERAKRRVEAGEDVVLVIDSLTRLALAGREPASVKPFFGAGRELEEEGGGSLTVIATALADPADGDGVLSAVATTENATLTLDPELAMAGVFPALDAARSYAAGEEALRGDAELAAARRLRAELRGLDPAEAAAMLRERIEATDSNEELLASV
jgi:transcription termination factor Rho